MPRTECQYEDDVLMMAQTGRWPDRAPAELRAHAAQCEFCSDLALVASVLDDERSQPVGHELPTSGIVWWKAQLRARQDAAREAVRPITATQALAFAAVVGTVGAVFGATTTWFQDALRWFGSGLGALTAGIRWPSLPSLPQDLTSVGMGYWLILLVAGFGLVAGALIVGWAMKEE